MALGLSAKLLTHLEELGFLTTHSGALWSSDGGDPVICVCSALLAVTCLRSSKHTSSDGGTKEDGPDAWS